MAVYLSFFFVLQSLISLLYVTGTQQAFLSVRTPVVYVVAGKSFSLDCNVNGSFLMASRVSWKHEGKWLHNQTQQLGTKVQLDLNKVRSQDNGTYQCSVYNFSGLSPVDDIPNDVNVTMLVLDAVIGPVCVSNGLMPPKISLIWSAVDDYQRSFQFTYNVFYCYKPRLSNKYCSHPPFGYNTFKDCTGLYVNSSSRNGNKVLECNVTSLFKRLVPNLFDIHAPVTTPKIIFSVNIGNIQSDGYSTFKACDPHKLVKCTKAENVRVDNSQRRMLSLVLDYPRNMEEYKGSMMYKILHTADGSNNTESTGCWSKDPNRLFDIRCDITGLHPYTLYHIYIACSINPVYDTKNLGKFIGPFSAWTAEEAPSHSPTIYKNLTSTVLHGEYRDVYLQWKLPDSKTWNGIITHIELHYWKANSSMPTHIGHVVVLSNVSMTTGNVTNLLVKESYFVVAAMCTRAGCGPQSDSILISPQDLPAGTPAPRSKAQGYFYTIIGVTSGVLLCIGCAFLVAWYSSKKLRKRRKQEKMKPLIDVIGKLSPPHVYESANEPTKREDSGDYDEAIAPLLSGDNDYVNVKASQPESSLLARSEHDRADFQRSSEV